MRAHLCHIGLMPTTPFKADCVNNPPSVTGVGKSLAEALNYTCQCISVDPLALRRELAVLMTDETLYRSITVDRPHLFSSSAVFVSQAHARRMAEIIAAVEGVCALPAYREHVLAWAPSSAAFDPGTPGVFLGYDFHLGPDGPQLIEINTNAGGALLNTLLARTQRACCKEMEDMVVGPVELETLEQTFFQMFMQEWNTLHAGRPLRAIAIVDDAPREQYLYPEFLLFQQMFRRRGVECVIADASELHLCDDALRYRDLNIDLVYNRLTDFSLSEPAHATLLDAYLHRQVVLTPHPLAHALYADKRNLVALTDADLLDTWRVPPAAIATLLAGIPRTRIVEPAHTDALWAQRKQLFFKPAAGYASKAAYRGDKLTQRVWKDILQGQYVAQALVAPSQRRLRVAGAAVDLKLDIRNYVYAGHIQLLASRLYQGQTTNFRTPGGGFAPVFCPKTD